MLRKPGQTYDRSARTTNASNRRRTQEGPDDIVRRLQRMVSNKKCADCSARLPQACNLTHGTFVCLTCCGVHREFNHRIKGIGHSSFTAEEAEFLRNNGNEKVNAVYLKTYNPSNERMRQPDGSTDMGNSGQIDTRILRVWFHKKYTDKAWCVNNGRGAIAGNTSRSNTVNGNGNRNNQNGHGRQATRVQIPPKTNAVSAPVAAPAPVVDLFGGFDAVPMGNDTSMSMPVATPAADAEWDAFGASRSQGAVSAPAPNANNNASFQADFGNMNNNNRQMQQQQQQQHVPQQMGGGGGFASFNAQPPAAAPMPPSPQMQQMNHQMAPQQQQQQQQAGQMNGFANFNASTSPAQAQAMAPQMNNQTMPTQPPQMQKQNFNPNFPTQHGQGATPMPPQQQQQFQQMQPPAQNGFQATFPGQEMQSQPTSQQPNPNVNQFQGQFSPQGQTMGMNVNMNMGNTNNTMQIQMPPQQQQNQNQAQMGMGMPNASPPSAPAPAPISVAPQPTQGFQANFPGTPPAMPSSMPVPQQQQQMEAPDPSQQMPPTMPVTNSPSQRVGGTQPPALDTNFQGQSMVNGMDGGMGMNQNNAQMQMVPSPNAGNNSVQQPPQQQQQPSQNGFQANFPGQEVQNGMVQQQQNGMGMSPMPPTMPPQQQQQQQQQPSGYNPNFQAPAQAPVRTNGAATNQIPTNNQGQEFNDTDTNNATSTSSDPFDAFNSLAIDSSSLGKSTSASTVNQQNSGSMMGGSDPSLGDKKHESKTNTSGTKYRIGQTLEYRDSQQNVSVVEVLRVHLDDDLVPFYDVRFENGKEKQTDDAHLRIPGMHDQSSSNTGVSMMNGMAAGSISAPSDPMVTASHMPSKELMIQKINELLQNLSQEQLQNVESYIKST